MNKQEFLERLKNELNSLNNVPNAMPQVMEVLKAQVYNIFNQQMPDDIYINEDPDAIFADFKKSVHQHLTTDNNQENNSLSSLEKEIDLLNGLNSGSSSFPNL